MIQYDIILYYILLHRTVLCCVLSKCIVLYNMMQYYVILYYIVLYYMILYDIIYWYIFMVVRIISYRIISYYTNILHDNTYIIILKEDYIRSYILILHCWKTESFSLNILDSLLFTTCSVKLKFIVSFRYCNILYSVFHVT